MSNHNPSTRPRVLVLGGGFGGVETAIGLGKSGLFDVALVSERDFLYLFPITIWIPTGGIKAPQTKVSLAELARVNRFSVLQDSVERIDAANNLVVLKSQTLSYDYLVVALGAGKPKPVGVEHTHSLCAGPQATIALRDQVDALVSGGSGRIAIGFGGNPKDGSAMRGGPAFEFLFNLDHLLRRKGIRQNFELTFFAPMPTPGARMGEKALALIGPQLEARNIGRRVGTAIKGFEPAAVDFADGSKLEADLIMFIPGAVGHPVVTGSGLPTNEAGFLSIDEHTLVDGTTNVYAVGDSAALEGPSWRAKQGHVAEAMAHTCAHNIIKTEQGSTERIGYAEHVSILCLMDTGSGGILVYRSEKRELAIRLPIIGHWLKRGWGFYSRNSKLGRFPRLPGL